MTNSVTSPMLSLSRTAFRPALSRSLLRPPTCALIHTLPDLPYAHNALEPYISTEIMELHHKKHHQAYVNGLNAAEEASARASTVQETIALQPAIKFNGGGHVNHSLFWKNLAPASSPDTKLATGTPLAAAVHSAFGSFDKFKQQFNTATLGIQGSGWGWLGYNKTSKILEIVTTSNQDPLLSHIPIIGVDIWEHAFYLQYKNVKPDYLNAVWNVINFAEAEKRYAEATK